MKKIFYTLTALAGCIVFTQCNPSEYLSVKSPDKSDNEFVTSSVSETFKTLAYCYGTYRGVAGGGNYNWNDSASDAEYYPEYNSNNGRIGYLRPSECGVDNKSSQFNNLYSILARGARVAEVIAEKDEFKNAVSAGKVNDWTQLYGEAWTWWAYGYFELVRHFGDVPYGIENTTSSSYTLTNRFVILDNVIAKLKEVAPLMYNLGEGGITAERLSRTFAYEIIAEANLFAGGYQTVRTDVSGLYDGITFETKYTDDKSKSAFVRRNDWKDYYKEAQTYFREVISGSAKGTATFIVNDDRSYADNAFQRSFQYIMDMQVSPDSIFEVGNTAPNQSERPYSQGRPSNGGNTNAAPCKVFGGIRVIPTFYYQGYEDGDKRWDASAVVTGSDGKGNEAIVTLTSGSRLNGGIAINKWDINKMAEPYVVKCRNSGMNYAFFRIPISMLNLAEVDAALGEDTEALSLLNQLRRRAGVADLPNLTGDELVDAVIKEVKRECLGEGNIKYAEIRTGKMTELGRAMRTELKTVIAGLEADGYYTFSNGRTISNYIWTKLVEKKNPLTYNRVEGDPALTPGWRGVADYSTTTVASAVSGTAHNLAIEGLFEYIDPAGARAAALEADGYVKTDWGSYMVKDKNQLWDYNMLSGIELSDVPLYYHPIPRETLQQSGGQVTNGYGLPQQ